MAPETSDLICAANVPCVQIVLLVCDCFHVEADRWNGGHYLTELQPIQHRRLAGGVESESEQSNLGRLEEARQAGSQERLAPYRQSPEDIARLKLARST